MHALGGGGAILNFDITDQCTTGKCHSNMQLLDSGNLHQVSYSIFTSAPHNHQFIAGEDGDQATTPRGRHVADDLPGVGHWVVTVNGSSALHDAVAR